MPQCIHTTPQAYEHHDLEWGTLTWFVSRELGNSENLTVGHCVIKPGYSNPLHFHPNCEEVLHLLQGSIEHRIEDGKTVAMNAGDTLVIPPGVPHNAKNTGSEDAIVLVSFSSADRQFVPVSDDA